MFRSIVRTFHTSKSSMPHTTYTPYKCNYKSIDEIVQSRDKDHIKLPNRKKQVLIYRDTNDYEPKRKHEEN